jgi:LPS-assembly protein
MERWLAMALGAGLVVTLASASGATNPDLGPQTIQRDVGPAAEMAPFAPPPRDVWPATTNPGGRWDACLDQPWVTGMRIDEAPGPRAAAPSLLDQIRVVINADQADTVDGGRTYSLVGNVTVQQGDRWLGADRMQVTGNQVNASGNLLYADPGVVWSAERGVFQIDRITGTLEGTRYFLNETLAQGRADRVDLGGPDVIRLTNGTYSTCSPASQVWELRVSRLELDRSTGVGKAWHGRLAVLGVPVGYVPYFSFPIDDRRKTGVLQPTITDSSRNGLEIMIPYYWNIAPNLDATLFPRLISERGVQLGGEVRYLQPRHQGSLRGSYLPGDDITGTDRWELSLNQRTTPSSRLSTDLAINRVGDEDVLRDFDSTFDLASVSHLRSQASARYRHGAFQSQLRADTYQSLLATSPERLRPYERQPELSARYTPDDGLVLGVPVRFSTGGSVVHFAHPASDQRDTATRLDLTPRLSLPYRRPAGFVEPAVSLRHTTYSLSRAETTGSESINRTLPVVSLDTGIFLDRHFGSDSRPLRQTLEPRAFYLYVPHEDQDDIPRFDTGQSSVSLSRLFAEDRFSGPDRVGDANQLALSLTSRLMDRQRGTELLRGQIGQVLYFEDREVALSPNSAAEDRSRSELFAEGQVRLPGGFSVIGNAVWDPDAELLSSFTGRIRYTPYDNARVTGSYRFRQNQNGETTQELIDISASWPLSPAWHAIAAWTYSSLDSETLEAIGGLQYQSCCWAVRMVNRVYRDPIDEETNSTLMFQIELRGLGSLGNSLEEYL